MMRTSKLVGRTRDLISSRMTGTYAPMGKRINDWKCIGNKTNFGYKSGAPNRVQTLRAFKDWIVPKK